MPWLSWDDHPLAGLEKVWPVVSKSRYGSDLLLKARHGAR